MQRQAFGAVPSAAAASLMRRRCCGRPAMLRTIIVPLLLLLICAAPAAAQTEHPNQSCSSLLEDFYRFNQHEAVPYQDGVRVFFLHIPRCGLVGLLGGVSCC